MNRVNERLSMNDPRHYQETHDFCQETKKKSKSRNLLQQRLDETIGKSIKEEKQRKIPSPFFLKEESLTDQEASLEETEKDSKFVWENDLEIKELETAYPLPPHLILHNVIIHIPTLVHPFPQYNLLLDIR